MSFYNAARTRQNARRSLHGVLAVPAVYRLNSSGAETPITARLHRKTSVLSEGSDFPDVYVETDRVVLLCEDLPGDPEKLDEIYFIDEDVTATVAVVEPGGPPTVVCQVTLRDGV